MEGDLTPGAIWVRGGARALVIQRARRTPHPWRHAKKQSIHAGRSHFMSRSWRLSRRNGSWFTATGLRRRRRSPTRTECDDGTGTSPPGDPIRVWCDDSTTTSEEAEALMASPLASSAIPHEKYALSDTQGFASCLVPGITYVTSVGGRRLWGPCRTVGVASPLVTRVVDSLVGRKGG